MSIKEQILTDFSAIGKSYEDVNYYRISPWTAAVSFKGKSNNIFDFMIVLDKLSNTNHLALGVIVFHDNTWLIYDAADRQWEHMKPPSYDELMNVGRSNE